MKYLKYIGILVLISVGIVFLSCRTLSSSCPLVRYETYMVNEHGSSWSNLTNPVCYTGMITGRNVCRDSGTMIGVSFIIIGIVSFVVTLMKEVGEE